jgi:hypothetical protein
MLAGRLHNQIEPSALIRHFLQHPPDGFPAFEIAGVPAFATDFDLLTTMEPAERRKLEKLPLHSWWRKFLRPRTCFVGATVSEYALLPPDFTPEYFIGQLLQAAASYPFLIIKDLPVNPKLVGEAAFAYSTALTDTASAAGFVLVEGQALAYVPIDFTSTEEFLARMPRSRRKDVKRKLKSAEALTIETINTGDAVFQNEMLLDEFYALYRNVYDQSEIHFDLLSPAFFHAVLQDAGCNGVVFTYRTEGKLIGYNLCFVHDGLLVDKYVGFLYPEARQHNLYFVSWLHNLQYALEHGLSHYVAGWTDPEIKRHLGASFTFTRHAVYVRNPWLRRILLPFKRLFEADSSWHETTHS